MEGIPYLLDVVPHLDARTLDNLVEHHITTAEELVGQIEAEPLSVGELLEMDQFDVHELGRRARQAIDPRMATAMKRQRGRKYELGALP